MIFRIQDETANICRRSRKRHYCKVCFRFILHSEKITKLWHVQSYNWRTKVGSKVMSITHMALWVSWANKQIITHQLLITLKISNIWQKLTDLFVETDTTSTDWTDSPLENDNSHCEINPSTSIMFIRKAGLQQSPLK